MRSQNESRPPAIVTGTSGRAALLSKQKALKLKGRPQPRHGVASTDKPTAEFVSPTIAGTLVGEFVVLALKTKHYSNISQLLAEAPHPPVLVTNT